MCLKPVLFMGLKSHPPECTCLHYIASIGKMCFPFFMVVAKQVFWNENIGQRGSLSPQINHGLCPTEWWNLERISQTPCTNFLTTSLPIKIATCSMVLALTTNFLWRMYWYWHSSQPGGSEFFFEETSSHFCKHSGGVNASWVKNDQSVTGVHVDCDDDYMRPRLCSIKENYRKDHHDKLCLTGWITLTPSNSDICLKLCTFLTCNAFQETMTFLWLCWLCW